MYFLLIAQQQLPQSLKLSPERYPQVPPRAPR